MTKRNSANARLRTARSIGAALCLAGWLAAVQAAPEKAAGFYEDALRRYERNDVAGAIVQLKNALQEDKRMLAAHLLLGKALLREGNIKGAEAAFEEALRQGVSFAEVAVPLAQVFLALGLPEKVIERLPATGLPAAVQVEALALRGTAYAESGNLRQALKSFEEARALDPKSLAPLLAEIPVLIAANQPDRARATVAKALDLAPKNAFVLSMQASLLHAGLELGKALETYDRALSIDPGHVDARVARAALLIDLGREAEAEKDLDQLKGAARDEPRAAYLRAVIAGRKGDGPAVRAALNDVIKVIDALPPAWLAYREQLLMVGALAHHGLGNRQKARDYLDTIIARNSHNLSARKLLASIYVETKDYARARSLLEAMQKAAPDDPQVLYLLGSIHLAQRRHLQATELLEKAAARSGSAEMNRALAFSQLEAGQGELGLASMEKAFAANPADSQTGTSLAMLYMRRGQVQKAIQVAETLVKRDPGNLTVLNFLGTVRGASGDKSGARSAYEQVLAKDREFRPAALNLARLDVGEGRHEEARRRLNAMLAKRHNDAEALFELGMLERRAGRPAEAIRHLQKAHEVQRRDIRPGMALIEAYLGQRQHDQAQSAAIDLSSKYPDHLAVQLALGRTYLIAGNPANARSVFKNATRLAEFDPVMQVEIARLQLAADNPDGARYNVEKALQGRPDDPAALALLVEIETRNGNAAKADEALKTLSARQPNRVETSLARANLAMARHQYPAAIAAYRQALAREESSENALNIARAHLAAGEPGKAATFLESWVKSHPKDLVALRALAEMQFRSGQLNAARQSYARALQAEPDDATTLNNYANLLLQLKDPAAQGQAEKALKLDPGNPAFADTLGWILVQQGQVEAGLRHLREARLRSPDNGEIRYHLAYALSKTGRRDEARDELKAALSGPGKIEQGDAVKRLKTDLGL